MEKERDIGIETKLKLKGIAFIFSHWFEKNNPKELDLETKKRLDKAIELYHSNKIAYFLVLGGEFAESLEKPAAKMMADYLVSKGISKDLIVEERHSKDTTSQIRFGKFLLGLKELDDLPIYYISNDYQLGRVKTIIEGQQEKKLDDVYISSGNEELSEMQKIKELFSAVVNKYDPEGRSALSKFVRHKRTHPIKKSGS